MRAVNNIMEDVVRVGSKITNNLIKLRVELVMPTETVPAINVTGVFILQDFQNNMADSIQLRLLLPGGTYQYKLMPNRDNVMVYVYTTRRGKVSLKKWRGVIQGYSNKEVEANDISQSSEASLNTQTMEEHLIQLIEPAVERMRTLEIGGNYMATTPENLVRTLMGTQMASLGLNGADKFKGMDIYPFDNQTLRNQYIFRDGTKLYDVPGYLQSHEQNGCGLYYTGVGSYYQNGYWYIWPLYHTRRFTQVPDGITVVNVPPKRLPTIETSYENIDGQLLILATGESRHADASNNVHYNKGNGARVVSADAVAGDAGIVIDRGKALKLRSESVKEFKTAERDTGVDYAPIEPTITNNVYRVMQRNALADGSFIQVNWQNADPSLVRPGAPVRYLYPKGDGVGMRYGVVLKIETHIEIDNGSKVDPVFHVNTGLTLFVESKDAT